MSYFQASLKQIFLKALIPLIIYGVISIWNSPLQGSSSRSGLDADLQMNQLNSRFSPLDRFQSLLLETYNGYFQFLFTMLVINLMIMMVSLTIKFIQRRIINSSKNQHKKSTLLRTQDDLLLSLNFGERTLSKHTSKEKFKGIVKPIILYSICYLFYRISGFSISHLLENHTPVLQLIVDQSDDSLLNSTLSVKAMKVDSMRILEVEEQKEERSPLLSHQNRERGVSLAIGKVLTSLNSGADSIVLSKDSKTAYVIVSPSKSLKVFDLTNVQFPVIISSPSVGPRDQFFSYKAILSNDENTLFICNERIIEIVNVSNPRLPKLIHNFEHQLEKKYLGFFGKMSLAIAHDDKTLFIGGAGLTILNVTHLEAPTEILKYGVPEDEDEYHISSLALASDGKTLYTTNGSLYAYNVADLSNVQMIYEYKTQGEANSILLSGDEKIAYIAGTTKDRNIIIEKVNISDKKSASLISFYEHPKNLNIKEGRPTILTFSPDETNIYIDLDIKQDVNQYSGLLDLNLMTGKFQDSHEGLVTQASSIVFLPDKKHVAVGSGTQLMILELFLDYPNSRVFSLSNHLMSSFETKTFSETMIFSSDKKIIFFTSGKNSFALEGWMEIWNVSSGNSISSTRFDEAIISMKLSQDNKKAYLMSNMKFYIYDILDLSSPKGIGTIPNLKNSYRGLIDFVIAGDDSVGYILLKQDDLRELTIKIVNLADNEIIGSITLPQTAYHHQLVLSKDSKRLFVIHENVQIFDVNNPSSPKQTISLPLVADEAEKLIVSSTLSADEKLLFVKTRQQNGVSRLKICNISVITEANVVNEIYLPKHQSVDLPSVFSPEFDKVYSIQQESILITDISDLKNPKILGLIPLPSWEEGSNLNSVLISPEENIIYILNGKKVVTADLQVPYSVYMNQEKFLLGRRYSDNVMLLKLDEETKRYKLAERNNYKFIKASLLEIQYVPNSDSTRTKFLPLLYWMNFDKENGIFSVEPKYQTDISTYTLCVTFARKIPIDAFEKLTNNSEKLLVSLITLGYIDNQRFLSTSFDEISAASGGDFLVMSDYSEIKSEIYEVLKGYLYKTCTKFEVIPSLELLKNSDKFSVGNLIGDNPRVDIKLDFPCKFLFKTYGNLHPTIPAEKDRITIEGSFKEVNLALQEIVVDLGQKNQTCGGEITLNDRSNPQVTETYRNISDYFIKNEYPRMASKASNLTIQDQFDATPISTGQFFALTLHEKTFTDKSSEKLTYEVVMNDTKRSPIPSWLIFRGLTFQGTPPEEIFGREVEMVIIVKNEFKETRVPFTLKIKMSSMFILKLVMRFAPYILTVIGFYISANRIYNIALKNRYRNPKNFYAEVGKEITDKEIFPVAFIKEEKRESRLIMKYLARSVVKELDLIDTHKYQVPFYFADPMTHHLNKARIAQVIEDVVLNDVKFEDKKKLRLYLSGDLACKQLIVQLVVNEIVMLQLNLQQEETTKSVFNKIKRNWTEIIERDENKYIVDKSKLNQVLIQKLGNSEVLTAALNQENYEENNESPILYEENYSEGSSASSGKVRRALDKGFLEYENKDSLLNMGLLEDALLAYAFDCQSLDVSAIDTVVFMGQKMERNFLYNFMKRDIREIRFEGKYGIGFRVQNETLHFHGCPEERFNGKIMVIQIKTRKERILREIWVYGIRKENEEQMMRESHFKGRRYEVL